MIILNTPTKSLEILLGGAITTNQVIFSTSYVDISQTDWGVVGINSMDGLTDGVTPVTILPAPGVNVSRQVKYISVFNADTASVTVTTQLNVGGVIRGLLSVNLAPNDTLQYVNDLGWAVEAQNGRSIAELEEFFTPKELVLEGSFKQFYDATSLTATVDFVVGGDLLSITGLVIGRTYEINFFCQITSGDETNFAVEYAIRHNGVNYNAYRSYYTRPVGKYIEGIGQLRHVFIATATTASIRVLDIVGGNNTYVVNRNCLVKEYINMPESTSMGIS